LENEVVQVWKSLENDYQISVRTLMHTYKNLHVYVANETNCL